jgi:hypothetical protein
MIDRKSFDDGLYLGYDRDSFDFVSREELGRFPIRMTAKEYLDFVELNLADWWVDGLISLSASLSVSLGFSLFLSAGCASCI